MANADVEKVQELKNGLIIKAEQLIQRDFPGKIVLLNEILESPPFNKIFENNLKNAHQTIDIPIPDPVSCNDCNSDFEHGAKLKRVRSTSSTDTQVTAIENGSVSCNLVILNLIEMVESHIKQLLEDTDLLQMWISLMKPEIERRNNFGVSVQENVLNNIKLVAHETAAFLGHIEGYFFRRAKLITKVSKYPHVEDYWQAVNKLDNNEHLNMWRFMRGIRDNYLHIYDLLTKNFEKIRNPRNTNSCIN